LTRCLASATGYAAIGLLRLDEKHGDQVCWTNKRKNGDWECPPSPVGGP
jgi:hypothetical protein